MAEPTQSPESQIPPFEEEPQPGGFKAVAQLFLVPAGIVAVAVGVFLAMNFLVGGEDDPEDILQRVATGDSRRRGQAAFELSKRIAADPNLLQDQEFRAQLLAVYQASANADVEQRRYLTRVLSFADIPEATPHLLQATRDEDPETRLYAVVALGNARAQGAFDRLVELSSDDDPGIRTVSVAALASLGNPEAVPALEARLNDGVVDVSWNAANALAHLGNDAGEPLLLQMLDVMSAEPLDENITEQQALQAMLTAVEGLGKLEQRGSSPTRRERLRELADTARFARVRDAAIRALEADSAP